MYSNLINKIIVTAIIVLLFATNGLNAQNDTLSQQAEISILTCSAGDELYSTFGHTGIRVKDPIQNIDVVFNYGMFSFGGSSMKDQVEFGVKFIRGNLEYWLGLSKFENFMRGYKYDERWVYEQVLNLSHEDKEELLNALIENYKPENRAYRYDFFFDNCSSRVRDILVKAVGPVFGDANSDVFRKTDKSFIDLIDPYIKKSPWLDLGMDIMLGIPSSRKASPYEFMFLPDHLMEQISKADGLVKSEHYLIDFPRRHVTESKFHLVTPLSVFTLLLLIIATITYFNYKNNKHWKFIDVTLMLVTGLMGCLFLFMWFGTKHLPAHANLNMFWAFPLNIIALFFINNKKWSIYFKIVLGFAGFILLAWFISPQQYHVAIIPISLLLIIRYLKILDWQGKKS